MQEIINIKSTLKKSIKFFFFTCITIYAYLFFFSKDNDLNIKIYDNNSPKLLAEATNFYWDTVCILPPYSPYKIYFKTDSIPKNVSFYALIKKDYSNNTYGNYKDIYIGEYDNFFIFFDDMNKKIIFHKTDEYIIENQTGKLCSTNKVKIKKNNKKLHLLTGHEAKALLYIELFSKPYSKEEVSQ